MSRRPALAVAVGALALAVPLAAPAQADDGRPAFAVIGDVPYGAAQLAAFPGWIDDINAGDPEFTVHVGDIKAGSDRCDDSYFRTIRSDVDAFESPFVYTPGDNEWTDCHRTTNGAYHPLERLAMIRKVFFDRPGTTLGEPMSVKAQTNLGFPENVRWQGMRVQFATLHVVGSENDLLPWTGLGYTAPTAEQVAEEKARMAASITNMRDAFARAKKTNSAAVVLFQQADMFVGTPGDRRSSPFRPLVAAMVEETNAFDGEVYLFDGDSHTYKTDQPLAAGSPWLTAYGVTAADDFRRTTVDGSENNTNWLKVTVNRPGSPRVLSWERVPYTG